MFFSPFPLSRFGPSLHSLLLVLFSHIFTYLVVSLFIITDNAFPGNVVCPGVMASKRRNITGSIGCRFPCPSKSPVEPSLPPLSPQVLTTPSPHSQHTPYSSLHTVPLSTPFLPSVWTELPNAGAITARELIPCFVLHRGKSLSNFNDLYLHGPFPAS